MTDFKTKYLTNFGKKFQELCLAKKAPIFFRRTRCAHTHTIRRRGFIINAVSEKQREIHSLAIKIAAKLEILAMMVLITHKNRGPVIFVLD